MKIVLVVTNTKRKNLVFVSNELTTYSLEEAIQLTREGKIEGAHIVQRGKNTYIRTNPSVFKRDEFDSLSLTIGNLFLYAQSVHITKISPINFWDSKIDLTKRPEIIATLYSIGQGVPKTNPQPNQRGMQIMKEFYPLAKKWLANL